MNKTTLVILEIVWIVIGMICIAAAIHSKVSRGGDKYLILAGMGLLAFLMAYIRDRQRKKM